ncbi:MAG TPA: DUF3810 domain-containing protein [Saprospiraceae bacterium]|nr:DUF3810 domain-containing protein [Saprospiraceae bacterium]
MKWNIRRVILPVLALIVFILHIVFSFFPSWVESFYYGFIFQCIRYIHDFTLGLLPFPVVYFIFIVLLIGLYWVFVSPFHKNKQQPWHHVAMNLLNFVSMIIFLFYFLWGFNYQRTTLSSRILNTPFELSTEDFLKEIKKVDSLVVNYRERLTSIQPDDIIGKLSLENHIRELQTNVLKSWGEKTPGRVRVRVLRPPGILLRFSTAGIYIPFANEGHIDKGLHSLQVPFTLAHEMAHGYGLTDEGECNFVAWVTCLSSTRPDVQYSGMLTYYRYLLQNYRRLDKQAYQSFLNDMDPSVWSDIEAIHSQMDRFPDIMPQVRDFVYDSYLRTHGISDGLMSYSSVVKLAIQWQHSGWNEDIIRHSGL